MGSELKVFVEKITAKDGTGGSRRTRNQKIVPVMIAYPHPTEIEFRPKSGQAVSNMGMAQGGVHRSFYAGRFDLYINIKLRKKTDTANPGVDLFFLAFGKFFGELIFGELRGSLDAGEILAYCGRFYPFNDSQDS